MDDSYIHIVKRTDQWRERAVQNYIIPRGVLCVELTPDGKTKLKVGEGDKYYAQLPYIGNDIDISKYFTKEEIERLVKKTAEQTAEDYLSKQPYVRALGPILPSVESLPKSGNKDGDLRFVKMAKIGADGKAYIEYLWFNNRWDPLSSAIDVDVSKYATKEDLEKLAKSVTDLARRLTVVEQTQHIHPNKSVLDAITAPFTIVKDQKLAGIEEHANRYILPKATKHSLGGVIIGDGITLDDNGRISIDTSSIVIPPYDDTEVKRRISTLETASHTHSNKSVLDNTTASYTIEEQTKLAGLENYVLPPATTLLLGGVIVGDGLTITEQGVLSTVSQSGDYAPGTGIIFEEPGYNYNSEYFCNTDVTAVFSPGAGVWPDRTYHRLSSGNAYVMVAEVLNSLSENWFCPIVISKTAGYVGISLQDSNVGYMEFTTPTGSVIYNGETWYYMYAGALRSPHEYPLYDTTGHVESFELTAVAHTIEDVVLAALAQIYPEHSTGTTLITNTGVLDVSVENGTMTVTKKEGSSQYNVGGGSLEPATTTTLGGVIVGDNLSIDANGVLSADAQQYVLPIASQSTLGGIKVGDGLSIDQDGVLSTTGGGGASVGLIEGPGIDLDVVVAEVQITALRFYITDRRSGGDGYMQFAELEFQDSSNNVITFSNVAGYIGDTSNPITYPGSGEDVSKLFDGSSSTKMCCNWDGSGIRIDMTLPSTIMLSTISGYRFMTANDSSNRDPSKWVVYALTTANEWILIDEQDSAVVPSARKTYTEKFPVSGSHTKTKVTNTGVLGVSVSNGVMTVTDKDGDTQYPVGGGGSGTEYVAGKGISIAAGEATRDLTVLTWEQGTVDANGDDDNTATYAIRSPFIQNGMTDRISVFAQTTGEQNMYWKLFYYDSNHTYYAQTSDWSTSPTLKVTPNVGKCKYIKIVLVINVSTAITPASLDTCELSYPFEVGKDVITNIGVTHIELNGQNEITVTENGETSTLVKFGSDLEVTNGVVNIPDYHRLILNVEE